MKPEHKACEHCGVTYLPKRQSKGRFCSLRCAALGARKLRPAKNCERCGKQYARGDKDKDRRWKNRRFCSSLCYRSGPQSAEQFWAMVDQSSEGCWEWQGKRDGKGYGRLAYQGSNIRAHRLALELTAGPLGDLQACHKCDNPPCCRPDHLFPGTVRDNARDMVRKGRAKTKLDVLAVGIIRRLAAVGYSQAFLAGYFGVTNPTVSNILTGASWNEMG